MRHFTKWVVVLVVPAVWAATAWPAEEGVPHGTTIKLLLLRQKSVQKELELAPETIQKVMDFTQAEHEAARKAFEQGEDARKQAFEELARKNEKFLTDNLTPKQAKRLDQITMQFTALHQLLKPEIAKELSLSDEQVAKLKELQKETHKELADLHATKGREGKTEKFAKLREETRMKILALLTDEQKAKVREMAGPPFNGEIVFEEPEDK
jgi:hypothetical protein